jgi:hypothetical protein
VRYQQFPLTVEANPVDTLDENGLDKLAGAFDQEARLERHKRAHETAVRRIGEARKAGASLYVTDMSAADFAAVLEHAPDLITGWIEGHEQLTADFQRRVRLAEPAYLCLTEALLTADPELGAKLWRAVRQVSVVRFVGHAGVDELIHLPFRAPDHPAVDQLRKDLLGLDLSHTDEALFRVALAASLNGRDDWLAAQVEEDLGSSLLWVRRRGLTLRGFATGLSYPISDAWPEGPSLSDAETTRRRSARLLAQDVWARHWWRTYWAADTDAAAYAAWVLLLNSVDPRAHVWMASEAQPMAGTMRAQDRRANVALNLSKLKRAMEKRDDRLDQSYLHRRLADGIAPWAVQPG